ncbi:flagellar protein FlaG [Phenylobacterium sp.]|jgi:flagellar protein FlaG|uniref:flagellar protein FlaG n=1 Tax=Phenylobacterium sp. TaxID=1871053 RepID=UPI002F91C42B
MANKVAPFAATPDPTFGRHSSHPQPQGGAAPAPAVPNHDPVDLRLIIEEDKASGSYVYKTVNRVTGEIVRQFPREEVLRMHHVSDYVAGGVVRTKA